MTTTPWPDRHQRHRLSVIVGPLRDQLAGPSETRSRIVILRRPRRGKNLTFPYIGERVDAETPGARLIGRPWFAHIRARTRTWRFYPCTVLSKVVGGPARSCPAHARVLRSFISSATADDCRDDEQWFEWAHVAAVPTPNSEGRLPALATIAFEGGCRKPVQKLVRQLVAGITDARDRLNTGDITGTWLSNRALLGYRLPPSLEQ